MIPNLKLDYVVLNAGVLRYPNVSSKNTTPMQKSRTNPSREPLSCTFPFAEPCWNRLERASWMYLSWSPSELVGCMY